MQLTLRRPMALPPAFAYLAVLALLALAVVRRAVILTGAGPRHAPPFGLPRTDSSPTTREVRYFVVRPDGPRP